METMLNPLLTVFRIRALSSFLLAASLLAACSLETNCGGEEVSSSPDDAKQRGFLLARLTPSKPRFTLPNGQLITFQQMWLEKGWGRNCQQHKDVSYDYKQIIIDFHEYEHLNTTFELGMRGGSAGQHNGQAQIVVFEEVVRPSYKLLIYYRNQASSDGRQLVDSIYLKPSYR